MSLPTVTPLRYHRTVIHYRHAALLSATANAFPRETLPRTNGIPEQSASSWRSKSHEQKRRHAHEGHTAFFGAANGIRTHDLVITNDVLYRLSYSSVSNA